MESNAKIGESKGKPPAELVWKNWRGDYLEAAKSMALLKTPNELAIEKFIDALIFALPRRFIDKKGFWQPAKAIWLTTPWKENWHQKLFRNSFSDDHFESIILANEYIRKDIVGFIVLAINEFNRLFNQQNPSSSFETMKSWFPIVGYLLRQATYDYSITSVELEKGIEKYIFPHQHPLYFTIK